MPVHNRKAITANFIEFLKKQSYANYHLILIDDGSTDGTSELVSSQLENLTIITGKGSWWWGGALHQGYKWIKKNVSEKDFFVLIMNDDTEFDSDFLSNGLQILAQKPKAVLHATPFSKTTHKEMANGIHFDYKNFTFKYTDSAEEINCATTRGLLMHGSDFINIGGFYPFLLPHYASDIEYTIRIFNRGYKLITHPDFKLLMMEEESGYGEIEEKNFKAYLKKHYQMRHIMNPRHWIGLIILVCPFPYNFKHLWILLKREYFTLVHQWKISRS